jgi:PAS domain S-box-containing protein/putative nucleotidyltransferase with HDIG domain
MVLDEEGRIVRFNRACEEVTGFSFSEVVGKRPWETLVPQEYSEIGLNYFNAISADNGELYRENYWRTKTGDQRLISWRSSTVRDDNGKFKWMIGIGLDITEQRASDEALRHAQERFRVVAESASDLIYECECHDGKVNWFGDIDGLLGYAPGEFPRTFEAWQNAIHPDDRDRVAATFKRLRLQPSHYNQEYRVVRRDGTVLYWTERGRILVDVDGQPFRAIGAISDVTDLRLVEQTARESQEQLRRVTENMVDIVGQINSAGLVEYISPSQLAILGYRTEDLLNRPLIEIVHPDDREVVKRSLQTAFNHATQASFDCRCQHAEGHFVALDVAGKVVLDETGQPVGTVFGAREITDRKAAEEGLRQTLHRLRRTISAIVEALAATTERRDPYTAGHQRRVADLACAIAQEMRMSDARVEGIRVAAALHDIGKISIPAEILSKAGKLSDIELQMVRVHAQVGYEILAPIDFPWPIAKIVLQHHERMNGSGYPNGDADESILIEARILAVADVVESMSSHRPYRPALGLEAALDEISKHRDTLYDPRAVDACLQLFKNGSFKLEVC